MEVSTQGKLLIVDDELSVRDSLSKWFHEEGYEVITTENAGDALTRLAQQRWDVALVDIKMHGTDGIELQRRMHEIDPELMVIMMTGYASVETAVAALKNGAYDYVTKPLDPDDIAHLVQNAMAHKRAKQENVLLREAVAETARPSDLIGQSNAMRKVFEAIETVGPTDATVLITGESGTGKELVARAIHQASPRKFHPLVAIHCGALTETLLESELFGHEKGAFTGAQYRKKGKFEIAEGGTVFLDEIGDITLKTQTDLLRVLQEREVTRVGGNQIVKVDFRCIAATNKDLEKLIEEGKFRPDLFYRLNVFRIELPPLSARREDIPLLVDHFVKKFSLAMNKRVTRVSPGAMTQLQRQPWVGNVRELENAVERAMVVGQEPELHESDFVFKLPGGASGKKLEEMERAHILRVVEECGGNQSHAAEVLDIDRVTLYHKLKKYGWSRSGAKADGAKSDSSKGDAAKADSYKADEVAR
jgi:two-component system, NtrC family, response regulator HydG